MAHLLTEKPQETQELTNSSKHESNRASPTLSLSDTLQISCLAPISFAKSQIAQGARNGWGISLSGPEHCCIVIAQSKQSADWQICSPHEHSLCYPVL
jgi:hypothetical protein